MKGNSLQSKRDVTAEMALLLRSPDETVLNGACLDWLSVDGNAEEHEVGAAEERVLLVTNAQSPDDLIERWVRQRGSMPSELGIIAVGEQTRSTTERPRTQQGPGILTTVESRADLAGLGIAICTYLDEWRETGGTTTVCFDSLTELLKATGVEAAFKFLVILRQRLIDVDAVAHFHLDPTAHNDQTIAQLREVFDTVVDPKPTTEGRTDNHDGFPPEDVSAILYKPCRLRILRVLLDAHRPMAVRDLADRVAHAHHESPSDDDIEQAHIALVHNHLPLLADYDLVATYDDGSRVEALDRAHEFISQLGANPTNTDRMASFMEDDTNDHDDPP